MRKKLLLLFVVSALAGAMHLLQAQPDYRPQKDYVHLKNGTPIQFFFFAARADLEITSEQSLFIVT